MTTDPRWEQVERELNIALRYYESGTIRGASFRDALAALRSLHAESERKDAALREIASWCAHTDGDYVQEGHGEDFCPSVAARRALNREDALNQEDHDAIRKDRAQANHDYFKRLNQEGE